MSLDKLPEKDYFSFNEIAERWECDNNQIEQLIDNNKIRPAALLKELKISGLIIDFFDLNIPLMTARVKFDDWTPDNFFTQSNNEVMTYSLEGADSNLTLDHLINKNRILTDSVYEPYRLLYLIPGNFASLETFDEKEVICINSVSYNNENDSFSDLVLCRLNRSCFKYITKKERDRFERDNNIFPTSQVSLKQNKGIYIESKMPKQKSRELVLRGWLSAKKYDESKLALTHAQLWEELNKAVPDLFRPASKETIKEFFQEQKHCRFKSGRRNGG